MDRLICDSFIKDKKTLGPGYEEFNQRITAINDMYGWLADKGILKKVSFEFKEHQEGIFFAFDAKDLMPYRSEMEASGIRGADLAVHYIFDESCSPCMYSGAIQPGWMMATYRNMDGCVGRSWECDLMKGLNNGAANEVLSVYQKKGPHAAIKAMFLCYKWPEPGKDIKPPLSSKISAAAPRAGHHAGIGGYDGPGER